jgi:hypothetical protein
MTDLLISVPYLEEGMAFCPTVCFKTKMPSGHVICDLLGTILLNHDDPLVGLYRCPACLAAERKAKGELR